MLQAINFPPDSEVVKLTSPAFSMKPPVLHNADLIADNVLQTMSTAWSTGYFAERSVSIYLLRNIYIVEEGLVFNSDGQLYRSTITQHEPFKIALGHQKVAAAINDNMLLRRGSFVLCKKRGVDNFGHYLIEMFSMAHLAKLYANAHPLRFIVPDARGGLRRVIEDSLAMLQISSDDLLRAGNDPIHVDTLLVVEGLTHHGVFMSPLVMNGIDALSARVHGSQHRKIYIRRPVSATRNFVNQVEIEQRAIASGYVVVDPSLLTFAEQIALFKNATDVVGVMGAALTNIVFSPTGTRVWNLAPASMPDTFFWFIAGLRGHFYQELRCRQDGPVTGVAGWDTSLRLAPGDLNKVFGPL